MMDRSSTNAPWHRTSFRVVVFLTGLLILAVGWFLLETHEELLYPSGGFQATEEPEFQRALAELEEDPRPTRLAELTPWEWDRVHAFEGYGPDARGISEAVGQTVDQSVFASELGPVFVFMNDGKIVRILDYLEPILQHRGSAVYGSDATVVLTGDKPWLVTRDEAEQLSSD